MQNNRKSTEGQKGDNLGEERKRYMIKKYKNKRKEETTDRGSGESTKRRNIG